MKIKLSLQIDSKSLHTTMMKNVCQLIGFETYISVVLFLSKFLRKCYIST